MSVQAILRNKSRRQFRYLLLIATVLVACGLGIGSTVEAQQDPPAAVELYNTGANLFGDQQYQLAIDQWNQLLNEYPEYSLRRDTQHYMALAHYNLQQFDKAVELFTSLRDSLSNIKDFRRSEKMLMYLAFSQYQIGKNDDDDREKNLKQSLRTYRQFFDKFPDSSMIAQALYFQGEALYELNRIAPDSETLKSATASYRKVVDDYPDSEIRKKSQFAYGTCLEESGDYEAAGEVFKRYVNEFPDEPFTDEVRLRQADSLLQRGIARKNDGDVQEAHEHFGDAEKIYLRLTNTPGFSDPAIALNQRAYCLLHMGEHGKAADLYATIANDHPDFEFATDAVLDAGKYYFTDGNMEMAEEWLTRVVDKNEGHVAEATHWLCRIKLENKEFSKALELANKALANGPGTHQVNLQMDAADAMYEIPERREQAIDAYQKIAVEFSSHDIAPKALYYAAFGLLTEGQDDHAIKTAQKFRDDYSSSEFFPDTLEVLGQAALRLKQLPLAVSTFTELVESFPKHKRNDWWQTRVGWANYQQGNYQDSIDWLTQAIFDMKDAASISEAQYVIGSSHYELEGFAKAIESLEAALKSNPERSNATETGLLIARAYSNLDNSDKALEVANRVWAKSRGAEAAYWLGELNYKAGNFAEAVTYYALVLEEDPPSKLTPQALYGLAWAQTSDGKTNEALDAFDKLLSQFPEHSLVDDALIGRGKTRRIAGRFDDAIEDLTQYLNSHPNEENQFNGRFERALCHVGSKNWKLAIADLEPLADELSINPDLADDILFELAWACQENGQQDESVQVFLRVATEYGNSPHAAESNYHVGQNHYGKEEFDKAANRYQLALEGSPDQRVGELAAYKLAWCRFKSDDYTESLKAFQRQIADYPKGELLAVGLAMVAESHFQLKQHSEAVTAYKVAIPAIEKSDVTNNVRILAPIHAAQSANAIKEYQSAVDYATMVINDHADSEYAAEAWFEIGVAQQGLGNDNQAVEAWTKAMKNSLGKTGARARCMIGESLFKDKKFDKAINQFKLVIYGYGGKQASDEVRTWQAFAAYEAARCYYVQIAGTDDKDRRKLLIDGAKELFQLLVENYPNDRLAEDARKQIRVLDSLK